MVPFVNIHTHRPAGGEIIEIVNFSALLKMDSFKRISFGIHPWDIEKSDVDYELQQLNTFLKTDKLVAVGEIGIDLIIDTPIVKQTKIFNQQLELAQAFNKPVIIHCVKAWSDLLAIRKQSLKKLPWIFHGYYGNIQTAQQLIQSGCFLSFGAALLHQQKVQETFQKLDLRYIFLETDDKDESIEHIYLKAAELKKIPLNELKSAVYQNYTNLFGN